ncbi:MAG: hypothetical protein Kow00121_34750 [Elainellaceae cyanobacterium]
MIWSKTLNIASQKYSLPNLVNLCGATHMDRSCMSLRASIKKTGVGKPHIAQVAYSHIDASDNDASDINASDNDP